jgi:hypothetical protein
MSELASNWDELCTLSADLLSLKPDESDILNLTAFLLDASNAKKNKIFVSERDGEAEVFNISTNDSVFIHDIFPDRRKNLINAVISCYPGEICTAEDGPLGAAADKLGKIVKINRLVRRLK